MMSKHLLLLGLFGILGFVGCASTDQKAPETAEAVFARAQELEKDGRTEEAIMKYQEVKNKFPYSKLATDAELAAANVSYTEESFPEAQAAYQLFRDLHPKHPKIPFVVFRLAMSIYQQIPEAIDRDLTLAHSAIETFNELINQFPDSEHVAEAKEKRLECLKKLAEKELYIANFYLKKQRWESALGRIETLLKDHGGLGLEEKALARGAFAANQANKQDLSDNYMARLLKDFPKSQEPDEVKSAFSPR
jgi:outer membrane protein assembly factor BamD